MKIKIETIIDSLRPKSIVHVGASTGAEVPHYLSAGADNIVLIEPIPDICNSLRSEWGSDARIAIHECVCLDAPNDVQFHIAANQGMSSSIYGVPNLNMHQCNFIDVINVKGEMLDNIPTPDRINLLVIDAQGSEDKVLLGASKTLAKTDYIFCEASLTPLYEGACIMDDLTRILDSHFELVGTFLNDRGTGDVLFRWKA